MRPTTTSSTSSLPGQHRGGQAEQASQREPVPDPHQLALAAALKQESVHSDGGDEQRSGDRRGHEREDIHPALKCIDRREPVHERQREHPGLRDAQLLQQLSEVAVRPLQRCLRAVLGVPGVVARQRRSAAPAQATIDTTTSARVGVSYPVPGLTNILTLVVHRGNRRQMDRGDGSAPGMAPRLSCAPGHRGVPGDELT
jgi:hypothetical protein